MATILLSSFVIRYPVGGVLSNNLQFLTGFKRLGHDVYLLEKAGYDESCFDPERRVSGDDCTCGCRRIAALLDRHGLAGRWCYVAADGTYHGLDRSEVEAIASRADLFIDRGLHRSWEAETADVPVRVLLDPDPGFRQIKMERARAAGTEPGGFDAYYTYGHNIGTDRSPAPQAGVDWRHLFHPIDTELYRSSRPVADAPCTTVMNWKPLEQLEFDGRTYGMKDSQFPLFERLPGMVSAPMEMAVEGPAIPRERLRRHGWHVTSALDVTSSYDAYHGYVRSSLAEFSVVKEVYAALQVGWFSDRSAAYLAHGRPVIVQDNGVRHHLPTGSGLFEVADADEAAAAIEQVARDPEHHSRAARHIAERYLRAERVLGDFLDQLGIPSPGHQGASP